MTLLLRSLSDSALPAHLVGGALCVIPTDTVYGVVCAAALPESVARLYAAKSREDKPGTIIAANVEQLIELGVNRRALRAVAHLWPNPVSVVLPDESRLAYIDRGLKSLAVRIPAQEDLRALLQHVGPLLTSSANLPGHPPAENIDQAIAYFGDVIDVYVDGGDLSNRPPSTLIRVVDDTVEVLREGALHINQSGEIE